MSTAARVAGTLLRFRWLIYELVLRDLRLRYRGSVFGFAWTLLNPLIFMGIYTLIFSIYFKVDIKNFPLYLLAGIIPWTWLSSALAMGTSSIVDGRMYVGKTLFPTDVLVVVPVLASAVNFALSLPILLVFAWSVGVHVGISLLAVPAVMLLQLILTEALCLLAATLNVFYRDLQQLVTYVITIGFYITPIFYTRSMVPAKYDPIIAWNPAAAIIEAYQSIFYKAMFPNFTSLLYPLLVSLIMLTVAYALFMRYRESFSQYV